MTPNNSTAFFSSSRVEVGETPWSSITSSEFTKDSSLFLIYSSLDEAFNTQDTKSNIQKIINENRDDPEFIEPSLGRISLALSAIKPFLSTNCHPPKVYVTAAGGIQFVWHVNKWDIEIEINSSDQITVWGQKNLSDESFFGDIQDFQYYIKGLIAKNNVHYGYRR